MTSVFSGALYVGQNNMTKAERGRVATACPKAKKKKRGRRAKK